CATASSRHWECRWIPAPAGAGPSSSRPTGSASGSHRGCRMPAPHTGLILSGLPAADAPPTPRTRHRRHGPAILLDCRWLPLSGAGRTVELLLRGLAANPPSGHWRLWGPPAVARLAWPGAEVLVHPQDPRAAFGQRDL